MVEDGKRHLNSCDVTRSITSLAPFLSRIKATVDYAQLHQVSCQRLIVQSESRQEGLVQQVSQDLIHDRIPLEIMSLVRTIMPKIGGEAEYVARIGQSSKSILSRYPATFGMDCAAMLLSRV